MEDIRSLIARRKFFDGVFAVVGLLSLLVGLITLLALILDLAVDGVPRLSWQFFTSFPSRFAEQAGILSAWVGTTLVMIVTAATAVPLGVAAGVYLEEYAAKNWMTALIEINIANLAAVPSIVYGLMALGLFVYQFNLGQSILTAGLTLALLILPMVIIAPRDAIGETAPLITIGALTFIAFLPHAPVTTEAPYVSFQWLMDPFTVMPIQMFNWVSRPQEAFHLNAAAAGLVLLVMTLIMNGLAIYIRFRFRKRIKW